jgi:hypothetical protein
MTRSRCSLPRLAALTLALGLAAAPARAAPSDGTFECSDVYGVALGLLTIAGSTYGWTKTDTGFRPKEAKENGSGTLKIEGAYFTPLTGPMAKWGVTAAIGELAIGINTGSGRLMDCRRR